jgi:hypothetical protein
MGCLTTIRDRVHGTDVIIARVILFTKSPAIVFTKALPEFFGLFLPFRIGSKNFRTVWHFASAQVVKYSENSTARLAVQNGSSQGSSSGSEILFGQIASG